MLNFIPLWYYILSALINFLTAAVIAVIVLLANKESKTNKIFSAFSFSVAYWSLLYFIWLISKDKGWAEFCLRSCMIGVLFMPSTFFHFVISFLNAKINKKIISLNYILSLLFTVTVYTPLYAKHIDRYLVFPYWLHTGPVFHFALIHFGVVVLYAFYLMWKSIQIERDVFRNQILYIFIGTAVGYISGVVNFFYWYRINIPPFLNIFISVYVIMVAIAIVRYHLLDINLALTRAGIFVVVYSLILGIPLVLGYKYSLWQASTWMMLFLATLGPFLYLFLQRRAEALLLKEQKAYQAALLEISSTMLLIKELDRLLKTIVLKAVDLVKVSWAGVYLKDEKQNKYILKHQRSRIDPVILPPDFAPGSPLINRLYASRLPLIGEEANTAHIKIGLAVPCFIDDNMLGFLLLGDKPKGSMYTQDDVGVFATLANQTALAIENCSFYSQERQREHLRRISTLDRQIDCMAHEIDNPIQGLLGILFSVDMTVDELKTSIPQDKVEYLKSKLQRANFNARRISKMIEAVKEFSKPTTGELSLINLKDLIDSFNYITHPQFKHHSVDFSQSLPEEDIWLRANKVELEQVLVNLATNSIQAMDEAPKGNKKQVSLNIYKTDNSLRLDFSDTGSGIKKELIEDIFLDFVTTKASSVGTGLGLAISRKIITRHKGRIWAESEGENKGAAFHIELPIPQDITEQELKKFEQERMEKEKRIMF